MRTDTGRQGIRLTIRELASMNVPAEVGARFETDQLEIFPAVFEVVAVHDDGVTVRRLGYRPAARQG